MMKSSWLMVIRSQGSWWVDHEGKPFGPFKEMQTATDGAIRLAETFGASGPQYLVWAPDHEGQMRTVWTSVVRPPAPAQLA